MKRILFSTALFLIVHISHAQSFDWAAQFSGNNYGQGIDIVTDGDGNVISTGIFNGTIDIDPGADVTTFISTSEEIYVTKQNPIGELIWAIQLGSLGDDVAWGITTDNSNNIYLTGHFQGTVDFDPSAADYSVTAVGSTDIFILKLNEDGEFLWVKTMGSDNFEDGTEIKIDASNNIIVVGTISNGTVDMDPGPGTFSLTGFFDTFILKLDASGNFVWAKLFTDALDIVKIEDVELDASGNIYTTGRFKASANFNTGGGVTELTSAGNNDIFLCKLTSSGDLAWVKQMGSSGSDIAYGIAIDESDGSNNILLTGCYNSTVDFDPSATTSNLTSMGDADIFVAKYAPDGSFIWAKSFGGIEYDQSEGILVNSNGYYYVIGTFRATVDFDPSGATANLTAVGEYDAVVIKLTTNGAYSATYQFGGLGTDWGQSICADLTDNIVVTGFFSSTVDLDPSAGIENFTTVGSNDPFVVRLQLEDASISNQQQDTACLLLYPNPASTQLSIQTSGEIELVEIFTSTGLLVQSENSALFSVEHLANGMYFISVQTSTRKIQSQFIKQ